MGRSRRDDALWGNRQRRVPGKSSGDDGRHRCERRGGPGGRHDLLQHLEQHPQARVAPRGSHQLRREGVPRHGRHRHGGLHQHAAPRGAAVQVQAPRARGGGHLQPLRRRAVQRGVQPRAHAHRAQGWRLLRRRHAGGVPDHPGAGHRQAGAGRPGERPGHRGGGVGRQPHDRGHGGGLHVVQDDRHRRRGGEPDEAHGVRGGPHHQLLQHQDWAGERDPALRHRAQDQDRVHHGAQVLGRGEAGAAAGRRHERGALQLLTRHPRGASGGVGPVQEGGCREGSDVRRAAGHQGARDPHRHAQGPPAHRAGGWAVHHRGVCR
mmetsp:Transcript_19420/g.48538  ORF Transcript_19420/g.48538 Transcript_19420/m.48538 type:complete len:321 (+) Transcript_19420:853-1815(+)